MRLLSLRMTLRFSSVIRPVIVTIIGVGARWLSCVTEAKKGAVSIGWDRAIYPTAGTARAAIGRGDLFVDDEDGSIVASAIINRIQPDGYDRVAWTIDAPPEEVLVLHTLVVDPACGHRGHGRAFVAFYEDMARALGCRTLRMDTNARNLRVRAIYARLGYSEAGIVPTTFNGIPGVQLVCLEKVL